MPNTGFHACGTAVSVDTGGSSWGTPTNAQTRDDVTTNTTVPKTDMSDWLRATNFGFDADVPVGATIDGIIVRIRRYAYSGAGINDGELYLWNGSSVIGENKADVGVAWNNAPLTDKDYGSAADKWSAAPTATLIRSSTFGVQIWVGNLDEVVNRNARVDVIEMCVYYTEGGTVYAKSIIAQSGTNVAKSRVVTAVRSKAALAGTAIPAKSRAITVARLKAALSGTSVGKSRVITVARPKAVACGTITGQSRVVTVARANTIAAGTLPIVGRTLTAARALIVSAGTKVMTARGWIRNYSTAIGAGTLAIVNRAVTLARPKIISGGTAVFPARIVMAGRQVVIAMGTKVNASAARIIARVRLMAAGTNVIPFVVIIRNIIERAILIPVGTAVNASRQIVLARLKTMAIGTMILPGRGLVIARIQVSKTGTKVNTNIARVIVRAKSLAIGTRTLASRGIGRTKSIAISLGTVVFPARQITVARVRTVGAGTKVYAIRRLVIVRGKVTKTGTNVIARLNRAYTHYILVPSGTAIAVFKDFAQHIEAFIVIATGTRVHVNAWWKFTRKHLANLFGPRNKFLSDRTRRGPDEHNRPQWGGHQR